MKSVKLLLLTFLLGIVMTLPMNAQEKAWYMIGHAHIDLSWLWPRSETISQVCPRTFEDILALMNEYPQLRFSQSAAQIYKWMEEYYPDLFARIQQKVKEGRWEIIGGSWDEHNTNIPCGESLARQYLYAKRYFWEKFKVDVNIGWLVDVFGFTWNMPQIYQKSGIKYFCTHKLKWQVERNNPPIPFPYNIFWWESPDGSRVLSFHTVGDYNERIIPERMLQQIDTLEKKHGIALQLIPYGRGDHGGGPARDMIERGLELQKQPNVPKLYFATAKQYFEILEPVVKEKPVPVINDELYVKTHQGTLTTDSQVKRDNRKCEVLLLNAEKYSVFATPYGLPYPSEMLHNAWEALLYGQVHDNLDGSSVSVVYSDAALDYIKIKQVGNKVLNKSLETISRRINTMGETTHCIIVYNPLPWERTGIVKLCIPKNHPTVVIKSPSGSGSFIPSQVITEDGKQEIIFIAKNIPSMGYKVFYADRSPAIPTTKNGVQVSGTTIENGYYRVEVDPLTGCIAGIFDKRNQREVLDQSRKGNILNLYEDKPPQAPNGEPAWNIYPGAKTELLQPSSVTVLEQGPVRAVIQIKKNFSGSSALQDVTLYNDIPWIECSMQVDWHEQYKFLKVAFPVSVTNNYATYEIPFGSIQRYDYTLLDPPQNKMSIPPRDWEPADRTKYEVAALNWIDLTEPDGTYGVSLLNDCKYGFNVQGNTMEMSLVRGPRRGYARTPDSWSDQSDDPIVGIHHITYGLYPHSGDWRNAETTRKGYELNYPLIARLEPVHGGALPKEYSFMEASPENVILCTVKESEDRDGVILRLYEIHGRAATARVRFPKPPIRVFTTDLIEWGKFVPEKDLTITGNTVTFPIGKYEIVTLKAIF